MYNSDKIQKSWILGSGIVHWDREITTRPKLFNFVRKKQERVLAALDSCCKDWLCSFPVSFKWQMAKKNQIEVFMIHN